MPNQRIINIYKYDELSDKAKEAARNWYAESALDHEWWDSIYEDAAHIGLKITSFDLDRNRHAKGQLKDAEQVAHNIIKEHGETCETHDIARNYLTRLEAITEKFKDTDDFNEEHENAVQELADELEKELLERYSVMLQNESEYLISDEVIEEGIRANDYEFLETGKIA